MDLKPICDALQALYAPGTITTPTSAPAMRYSYAQTPASMPATPSVVIVPQDGTVVYGAGQVNGEHRIDVNFYLSKAPGDPERVETNRQRWLGTLLAATHGQLALGLSGSGVTKAFPTEWEFTELPFGGDNYDGIVIHLTVFTRDNVTLTP